MRMNSYIQSLEISPMHCTVVLCNESNIFTIPIWILPFLRFVQISSGAFIFTVKKIYFQL